MRTFRFSVALILAACSTPVPKPVGGLDGGFSGTPCSSANQCQIDAGYSCTLGICSRACSDTQPCGNNEVCGDVSGKKRCLSLCEGDTCAAGSPCQFFWPTRQRVCARAPLFGACKSVINTTPCTLCSKANYTSTCPDGLVCPSSSTCGVSDFGVLRCFCEPGFDAFNCDGTPCGAGCEGDDLYSCRPTEPVMETCVSEPHGSAGTCVCADGRMLPFVCGETDSCEQRCATGCNLAASDCPEQTQKCNVAFEIPGHTVPAAVLRDRPVCTDLLGNRQRGETCKRIPQADGGLVDGRDDCGGGLVCDATGEVRGDPRCHKLCTTPTACGSGESCRYVGLSFPTMGICVKSQTCTIGGIECGAGRSCIPAVNVERDVFTYCKSDGDGGVGGACANAQEDAGGGCGPDLVCNFGKCAATCSPQKPCVTGKCNPVGWMAADPGYCE